MTEAFIELIESRSNEDKMFIEEEFKRISFDKIQRNRSLIKMTLADELDLDKFHGRILSPCKSPDQSESRSRISQRFTNIILFISETENIASKLGINRIQLNYRRERNGATSQYDGYRS